MPVKFRAKLHELLGAEHSPHQHHDVEPCEGSDMPTEEFTADPLHVITANRSLADLAADRDTETG